MSAYNVLVRYERELLKMKNYTLMKLNNMYSKLWIALTGKDKFEYREKSHIHKFIVSKYEM